MWCETSNAENQQICDWIVDEVYADLLNQGSKDHLFVMTQPFKKGSNWGSNSVGVKYALFFKSIGQFELE